MERHRGSRSVERAALWAFLPVIAMAPFTVLALALIWLPFGLLFDIRLWWVIVAFLAAGLLLFVRPFQVLVLTPILGARRPTADEAAIVEPIWRQIAQANDVPAGRYVLRVLPSDDLNAYACGGHLVIVTTFAASRTAKPVPRRARVPAHPVAPPARR
jgi:hypothetical protein